MAETRSLRDLWTRVEAGEIRLIDLRSPDCFGQGHPAGAISVVYSERGLAERIATVAGNTLPVVVVTSDPVAAAGAARQLEAAGRDFLGAPPADPEAWQEAGASWATLPDVAVAALAGWQNGGGRVVLDVREPLEWETGFVPGALLIPLGRLSGELDRLPREAEIAVICEAGVRSATAASLLRAAGFPRIANVREGTAAYRAGGWPLAFPPDAGEEIEER